ncbi:MAG: M15 family metallopeptidase [Myxococcales bacterium]|nr:M15 family metallopeptidase [Myxococcales bacterium]
MAGLGRQPGLALAALVVGALATASCGGVEELHVEAPRAGSAARAAELDGDAAAEASHRRRRLASRGPLREGASAETKVDAAPGAPLAAGEGEATPQVDPSPSELPRPDAAIEPATPPAHAPDDDEEACERRCVGGDQGGDDLLTPIDRSHGLRPGWAPEDLVALDPPYVIPEGSPPNLLRREAAEALVALSDAAFAATGIRINIRSGYRSFELQCGIFKAEARRQGCVEATRSSARAGFSEHQLGTTADLAIGWRRLGGDAAIDAYLDAHAHEFGWVLSYPEGAEGETGYKHEPWHYRYLGRPAARALVAGSPAGRRLSTQEFLAPAGDLTQTPE